MRALSLLFACALATAQEAARPPIVLALEAPPPAQQAVPVDLAVLQADLVALLQENGLAPAPPAPGRPRLVLYPETFRLPKEVFALSVQALYESPGPSQVPRARVVAAVRGSAGLPMELRQAVLDVAAVLLEKGRSGGTPIKGVQVEGGPPPAPGTEIPFERLKVRVRPLGPEYPALARDRGIQGTVMVRLKLDASGSPVRADLVSGPQELSLAALQHAMLWRFHPVQGPGGPVPATTSLRIPFDLSRGLMNLSIPIYEPPRQFGHPEH